MKVKGYTPPRRAEVKDEEGRPIPKWVEKVIDPVNEQLKALTQMAQGQVGLENLNEEVREFRVRDGVDVEFTLKTLRGVPLGVVPIYWDHYSYMHWRVQILDLDRIRMRFSFETPPVGDVLVRVLVRGK